MSKGFFSASTLAQSKQPPSLAPRCGECGLYKHCKSPKMVVTGEGRKRILILAEAPGSEEDERGIQLVGKSGQYLRSALKDLGVSLDIDCWKTNALICRPGGNRTPTDAEIDHCRPNLLRAIKELKPTTIITFGLPALTSVIGHIWKDNLGVMARWVGWKIPLQRYNAWVCPLWHPSYLLREESPVLDLWFNRYLKAAVGLAGRPWETLPDYDRGVEIITSNAEAYEATRQLGSAGGYDFAAFDFETNCLKPETKGAKIVSCSISVGDRTIAFPWTQKTHASTWCSFMQQSIRKIASNMKFEERWSKQVYGHLAGAGDRPVVQNWFCDTMQLAHVLDSRPGITSIKFQSFVRLGAEEWSSHITPFFEPRKDGLNRIDEIALTDLLRYNAQDSLREYLVAKLQLKELKERTDESR